MFKRRLGFVFALAAAFGAGAIVAPAPSADAKNEPDVASAQAFFSPGGGIEPALLDAIKSARSEIIVAMYNFTSRPLAEALVRARARGVEVRILLDKPQAFVKYSKTNDLRRGKCDVRLVSLGKTGDDQPIRYHHKFMVVDRTVVTTGSFNWTSQADDSNFENEVVIASKRLGAEFREEFEKSWTKAEERMPAAEPDRTDPGDDKKKAGDD
jgi:phosphatidylserine/phosphatidylglycerophosphate/cardiolipin synthase-like enzyme